LAAGKAAASGPRQEAHVDTVVPLKPEAPEAPVAPRPRIMAPVMGFEEEQQLLPILKVRPDAERYKQERRLESSWNSFQSGFIQQYWMLSQQDRRKLVDHAWTLDSASQQPPVAFEFSDVPDITKPHMMPHVQIGLFADHLIGHVPRVPSELLNADSGVVYLISGRFSSAGARDVFEQPGELDEWLKNKLQKLSHLLTPSGAVVPGPGLAANARSWKDCMVARHTFFKHITLGTFLQRGLDVPEVSASPSSDVGPVPGLSQSGPGSAGPETVAPVPALPVHDATAAAPAGPAPGLHVAVAEPQLLASDKILATPDTPMPEADASAPSTPGPCAPSTPSIDKLTEMTQEQLSVQQPLTPRPLPPALVAASMSPHEHGSFMAVSSSSSSLAMEETATMASSASAFAPATSSSEQYKFYTDMSQQPLGKRNSPSPSERICEDCSIHRDKIRRMEEDLDAARARELALRQENTFLSTGSADDRVRLLFEEVGKLRNLALPRLTASLDGVLTLSGVAMEGLTTVIAKFCELNEKINMDRYLLQQYLAVRRVVWVFFCAPADAEALAGSLLERGTVCARPHCKPRTAGSPGATGRPRGRASVRHRGGRRTGHGGLSARRGTVSRPQRTASRQAGELQSQAQEQVTRTLVFFSFLPVYTKTDPRSDRRWPYMVLAN